MITSKNNPNEKNLLRLLFIFLSIFLGLILFLLLQVKSNFEMTDLQIIRKLEIQGYENVSILRRNNMAFTSSCGESSLQVKVKFNFELPSVETVCID